MLLTTCGEFVKSTMMDIADESDFNIEMIEVDGDHLHILVDSTPTISPSSICRTLKQISTYRLYRSKFKKLLRSNYWNENTFWADGQFICTTGDASTETIKKYIENQG
jgi:putative transposase